MSADGYLAVCIYGCKRRKEKAKDRDRLNKASMQMLVKKGLYNKKKKERKNINTHVVSGRASHSSLISKDRLLVAWE